jgi:hypothetical protein
MPMRNTLRTSKLAKGTVVLPEFGGTIYNRIGIASTSFIIERTVTFFDYHLFSV